jgi:hypothetical protein
MPLSVKQKTNIQRRAFKAIINLGMSLNLFTLVVGFALKRQKKDFLKKLKELLDSFVESLGDKEKKELQLEMRAMMRQKAREFLGELKKGASEKEIDRIMAWLKDEASLGEKKGTKKT